jgi:hypothetical protein
MISALEDKIVSLTQSRLALLFRPRAFQTRIEERFIGDRDRNDQEP